ncbi:MAG: F0F1 ATP synthase subunit A [Bryobacterales bacterium]|nr:F0F1 ATP synthase subunit A [Bryobacterales bacterium]
MPEHELWVTALFNRYLAGVANWVLSLAGIPAEHPDKPWANFIVMQFVVALIVIVVFAILRPRLSVDRPGKMQHVFEIIYGFIGGQADEVVGHEGRRYMHLFTTIFLFVLLGNLLGIVPSFESPTMFAPVPLGIALVTFSYYNLMGCQALGFWGYLKQFCGPMPVMAPLMIPIELISHVGRLLSLTVRLYANMFAGEQVTLVFISLVPLVVPAVFMGLHVFVSFLQAFVFALLTMIYLSGAVSHEH